MTLGLQIVTMFSLLPMLFLKIEWNRPINKDLSQFLLCMYKSKCKLHLVTRMQTAAKICLNMKVFMGSGKVNKLAKKETSKV